MEFTILDIGCGDRPRGTTNLDFMDFDVPNFVKGDALNLPFEDKSFNTAYSSGLSLWSKNHEEKLLIKSWEEAIRVAKDLVVFEYNYLSQSNTWPARAPLGVKNFLEKSLKSNISLDYSQRGKFNKIIRVFEKIFGTKLTISILNKIFRKSYLAKFTLKLTNNNVPECL
ncbi:MAG: class I SAM-dependent methyltransferase [Candidatus Heimdallarchaeota archaeon]|nr:class I SAM-dependent methyltransferase [Candidatus Heimdallarchaeota archaeon]